MAEIQNNQHLNELYGIVNSVTFRKEENGFTVLELDTKEEIVTVVGVLPEIFAGEELKLQGTWQSHPSFGPQFRAELCERRLPASADAIFRYLSSRAIKGIGPVLAARIVDRFGDSTLNIIEKEPGRLAEIEGISPAKAQQIAENFKEQFGIRDAMMFLGQYGLTPAESLRVWKKWGVTSTDKVKNNPYILCSSGISISFERADSIAMQMDCSDTDGNRVRAGIFYVLRHNLSNGHTCLPKNKLCEVAANMLSVDTELTEEQCEKLIELNELISYSFDNKTFVFIPKIYNAEKYVANRLLLMLDFPSDKIENFNKDITRAQDAGGFTYEEKQLNAISMAMEKGILVLTGGPGTGKTTTLNAIIDIFENNGLDVAVTAPTGRAAKRLSEVTGREAKTVHRLLEAEYSDGEKSVFARDEKNPLKCDAVIIDEISMIDIMLFDSLLKALPLGCRLIMVGDSDQLPSVGAGNVLHDILDAGKIPSVALTEIFRQSEKSAIVTNAHKIVAGEMPVLSYKDNDFFFIGANTAGAVSNLVLSLCTSRLPNAYKYSPIKDIQVLCPGKKGICGTIELNRQFQEILNPSAKSKREIAYNGRILREGDKVMQIKNNYDIEWTKSDGTQGTGVFNGDVGILTHIDKGTDSVIVEFDNREAVYPTDGIGDLELAYAITVHKSQGSEFEAVVMPVFPGPPQLYFRNLLYTAVTRAKNLLVMVGMKSTVEQMVKNDKKTRRFTALSAFLKQGDEQ